MQNSITLLSKSPSAAHSQAALSRINFDSLPDAAFVSLFVVCSLFGCSQATVWRRVKSGLLVKPHRIGVRTTRWNVGELRQALADAMLQH